MNFEKGVLFDPGYSKFAISFSQNALSAEEIMSQIKAFHQKRFQYKMFQPKLINIMHNSVSFYLGCLLWADYLVCKFVDEPKNILNNPYAGKIIDEKELFYEVDFILSYFDKIRKDSQYYFGKPHNLPDEWYQILLIYKKFLELNAGFSNVLSTKDIKLPDELKKIPENDSDRVLLQIESVLASGKLEDLFVVKDFCL